MGSGFRRRIKMSRIAAQVKQMEEETKRLITDPEGSFQKMAKPLVAQLQTLSAQQNKLSALVCALLENSGGSVSLKRGAIDRFQQHRLTVLSEAPEGDDGENPETLITFTYKAEFVEQPPSDPPAPKIAEVADNSGLDTDGTPHGHAVNPVESSQ